MNPNTVVVDAGNWGDINPDAGKLKTDFIFKMMKRFGTDVVTLGERELGWGVDHFTELANGQPEIVLSNVKRNGEPVGKRYHIKDVGGVRVGTFSLTGRGVLERGTPDDPSYSLDDIFETAENVVEELENEGCEIIVLLAQTELSFADSVVRRVPEIDVAVLGYRGGLRSTHSTIGQTIVMRTGNRGQYAGHLDLVVDPSGEIVEYGGRSVVLDRKIEKDPAILTLVNEMKAETGRAQKEGQLLKQREYSNQLEVDRYIGAEMCARCHQPEYEQWAQTAHASAWTTLVDVDMHESEDCVSCHVTGHGESTGFEDFRMKPNLAGVQCEACHNMGTLHAVDGSDRASLKVDACVGCHDAENSPDFDLADYLEKIRHW